MIILAKRRKLPDAPWALAVWRYLKQRKTEGVSIWAAMRYTGLCRTPCEQGMLWLIANGWVRVERNEQDVA